MPRLAIVSAWGAPGRVNEHRSFSEPPLRQNRRFLPGGDVPGRQKTRSKAPLNSGQSKRGNFHAEDNRRTGHKTNDFMKSENSPPKSWQRLGGTVCSSGVKDPSRLQKKGMVGSLGGKAQVVRVPRPPRRLLKAKKPPAKGHGRRPDQKGDKAGPKRRIP